MKRTLLLVACFVTLAACGSDSSLPNPTGKGAVRMINTISGSPEMRFLIEERLLASARYKESTSPAPYDDFSYRFNFEVGLPGETTFTRVASRTLQVEKDREHVFVVSGDATSPDIAVWDWDIRTFNEPDTVLEARFSHGGATLGAIDVYFDPAGTVLGANPPAATLSFGDVSEPFDYEAGEYVLTVTVAGDVNTVLFTTGETDLLAQFAHLITVFDGDANNTGPVAVRSMTGDGNPFVFRDVSTPPQVRFIHTSFETEAVDVYDDEQLSNLVAADLPFLGTTADLDTDIDETTFYFTPAGSTAQVLFEQLVAGFTPGTFSDIYVVGSASTRFAARITPDRAPHSTSAKLRIFSGSVNYDFFDVYLVERGAEVTAEDFRILAGIGSATISPIVELLAGSYDLYLTEANTRDVISPAFPADLTNGSIVDLIAVDTVDTAVIEAVDISRP